MKKAIIGLAILMSISLYAQTADTYLELLKSDIKIQKKTVVAVAMDLNELQDEKFWPLYNEYEAEWDKLTDVRIAIIKEYASNFETLTDEVADDLIKKSYDLEEKKLNVQKKYYEKVKDQLGARDAGKFIQVVSRLNMLINIQIAAELPLFPVDVDSTSGK